MALATRTGRRPSTTRTLWDSSVGKKSVMAVSGLIMLGYLVAHMLGNLKIFFGAEEFNGYAHWLRTLGAPVLHHEWALWIVRAALVAAVLAHGICAYQLSRRDIKARPVKYARKRRRASYSTRTMRWGGVILALFIVWHLLDLTTLTVNERAWAGHPYENVLATFSTWYGNTIYLVAMAALGLHVRHGFWSAAQTLGAGNARRERTLKFLANALALVLFSGFVSVPVAVMTGVVS
ncbi:succinate dehydrogenase cytochrome b subunit [Streptomyces sp. ISL-43]|uniref:succinate dehydrogenase cytochrome b subunit n=1 Tax=Streptomyces sp. ISL-43 TaxID=2819183 RepID=UPI001BE78232|nr:succinate dehydrogenase cytochrome b subunit [Streptomyces sp. ISL-43]MBT2452693.1 succinate dehydrogenase cytochrome b subunit [Streptomyces sp. ISL-43]